MVFGEILTGIALVKSSVEFIKSNIGTCKDISEIAGHIDGLFEGKNQLDKKRNSKDGVGLADQFGVKSVAHEIIDAKLAAEELYNISVLVDQRFGHGTWQTILTERSKRIEAAKAAKKEQIRVRKQQQQEIAEMLSIGFIILVAMAAAFGGLYILWNFL